MKNTTNQVALAVNIKNTIHKSIKENAGLLSEGFWFTAALALFTFLGAFSAPIVLIALYKFAQRKEEYKQPELMES